MEGEGDEITREERVVGEEEGEDDETGVSCRRWWSFGVVKIGLVFALSTKI